MHERPGQLAVWLVCLSHLSGWDWIARQAEEMLDLYSVSTEGLESIAEFVAEAVKATELLQISQAQYYVVL